MSMFINQLVRLLDLDQPGWEEESVILLDNASWHRSTVMMKRLARMNLPIIFSGPFSYSAAAVETVFAHLKLGDLNPEKLPTGKKSV